MKNRSPYETGTSFWSKLAEKLNSAISVSAITNPVIRTMQLAKCNLTEDDFDRIRTASLFEVYCFAAYSAYVAGSRLFVKLLGFDRVSWVEFIEGVSAGLRAQTAALPNYDDDSFFSREEAADRAVIQYMQTFTKGDARANVAWILAMDKGALQETFREFAENLEEAVRIETPDGVYPGELMHWCPDAEYIYTCAAECASK